MTDDLKATLTAFMEGSPSQAQQVTLYETVMARAGVPDGSPSRGLAGFSQQVRVEAAERLIMRWLDGRLVGKTLEVSAAGYVARALRNACLDEVQRQKRSKTTELPDTLAAPEPGPEVDLDALDAGVGALLDERMPGHLEQAFPRQTPATVVGHLRDRYEITMGRCSLDEVVEREAPGADAGTCSKARARLMRGQRRAVQTCAALGRELAGRRPPDPDAGIVAGLAEALRMKRANGEGRAR